MSILIQNRLDFPLGGDSSVGDWSAGVLCVLRGQLWVSLELLVPLSNLGAAEGVVPPCTLDLPVSFHEGIACPHTHFD